MHKIATLAGLVAAALLAACATGGKPPAVSGLSLMEAIEQSAEKTAGELPRGSRVAVVAFVAPSEDLSELIMEELNGALKDRGVGVVDRQNLKHVLQELNFQMSGYVSDESARSVGKFLGADIVITGQLTSFGDMYRFRTSAIFVETAARLSITRFDVRNDQTMQQMADGAQR
jgi:curli biogenesis system outer membrane secretion channel CsgG